MTGAAHRIASFAGSFTDLSPQHVERFRRALADTLACAIGGANEAATHPCAR
jgi:2-methylcitrate dehydratase PrpD